MSVRIHLPSMLEEKLRREHADLERTATESLLVELFRQGRVTHYELAITLGMERREVDSLIQRSVIMFSIVAPSTPRLELVEVDQAA